MLTPPHQPAQLSVTPPGQSVILFDGVCNLCNGAVQFILRRDPREKFLFASLQSAAGQSLLTQFNLPTGHFDSFVLVENNRVFTRSSAALRVARQLNGLWPVLYGLVVIPRPLRDAIYDLIARNRYRWFGKRASCMLPTPALKTRFL